MVTVEIKTVRLSDIKLNPDNPRTITKKAMGYLVKSLTDFPEMMQLREIVVDETMTILGGNMRLLALKKTGEKDCMAKIVKGLSPEQKREFVIKDNSAFGEWDMDALANSWSDLPLVEWGVDLPEDWLKQDEPKDSEPQIDRAEELNKKWQVKTGDLWQIGEHRLLCGDSTKAEDVERVMGGAKTGLCITSPPYFNQREYSQWENYGMYLDFVKAVVLSFPTDDNAVIGINIGSDEQARRWMPSDWWCILRDAGWEYRECFAWVKSAAVWSVPRSMHIENGHYFPALRWEIILCVAKGKHPNFDIQDRDEVRKFDENVWQIGVVTGGE